MDYPIVLRKIVRKTFEAVEAVKTVEAGGSVLNVSNVF